MLTRSEGRCSRSKYLKMTRLRLCLLVGSCVTGILVVVISNIATIPVARIVLGLLFLFFVPGFALVSAVLPGRVSSFGEELLADVGASVAVSTTATVALAAAPVGLSRLSILITLEICTLIFSVVAVLRARLIDVRRRSFHTPDGTER